MFDALKIIFLVTGSLVFLSILAIAWLVIRDLIQSNWPDDMLIDRDM